MPRFAERAPPLPPRPNLLLHHPLTRNPLQRPYRPLLRVLLPRLPARAERPTVPRAEHGDAAREPRARGVRGHRGRARPWVGGVREGGAEEEGAGCEVGRACGYGDGEGESVVGGARCAWSYRPTLS